MHYAEVAFGPKPEASEEEVCNVAAACRPWPARYAYKFQTSSLRIWLPTLVSLAAYGFSRRSQLAAGAATAFRFLDSHYVSHPLVTKACTSGAAYLLGDLLAQRLTTAPRWRALDVGRTFRSTFAGFVSHGPQLHYWCLLLDRYATFGGAWWACPLNMMLDQTVFALYINAAFCLITETLRRPTPAFREVLSRIKTTAWPTLRSSWRYWPFVHLLTFSVVPLHLRVLWVDVMEVGWVCLLSLCMARKPADETAAPPPTANADALAGMEGRVVPTANAAAPERPLSTYSAE